MKKSKLQVMIEFSSWLNRIKASKKIVAKAAKSTRKGTNCIVAIFVFASILIGSAQATTYYSRTSGGNWNTNTTWSTVGYGNATNTGTFPQAGDVANIGDGYTVNINTSFTCATLNIGQGVSGTLQYLSTANFTGTVTGNVTLNTGAKFWYNTAVNRTHVLNVGANFANFGIVDFYINATQVVNVTFNNGGSSTVSGIGTWDLNTVTLNKASGIALLNVQSNGFETGIKNFVGSMGTYIHNNAGTYNINPTAATFIIGPNMTYKVPLGAMNFASAASYLYIQGALYVNGGSVSVGTSSGLQGIRSDQNGAPVPYLEVSSGSLTVYGGITYSPTSAAEPFSFNMTGGTILLNSGTTGTNRQVFLINDVAGSSFQMTGGTITLQKPNTAGSATVDVSICGTNGTVVTTGGTIQFGNASTASGKNFNFKPFASAVYPNFKITGNNAALISLSPSASTNSNFQLLSLYIDIGKTFDNRCISGTAFDSKQMTLLSTANGTDAIYNNGTFTARTGTVTFNTTGAQAIGGTSISTFYNLVINNTSNITLNKAANVSNFLSMVSGNLLTTNTNILTCQSAANASLGSASSYVDGPLVQTWATAFTTAKNFPVGKGVAYRPVVLTVQHSNATPVTYRAEIINSPASALPFSLPVSLAGVSGVRYVLFNRQNVANFTSGTIQMYYGTDDGVANFPSLMVAHDDGISTWQNFGGIATANGTGNITSNPFTNFNTYFALASPPGGGNPLPVELATFNAELENKSVNVNWTTQSEVNNDYFTLERSLDNVNYERLTTVEGAGNTTTTHTYSYVDHNPYAGTSYYRLKQTDFDGHYVYFHPVSIFNKNKKLFTAYPNPSNGSNIKLNNSGYDLSNCQITVQDMTGKVIPSTVSSSENFGELSLSIDKAYCRSESMFIVTAVNNAEVFRQKIIIGRE